MARFGEDPGQDLVHRHLITDAHQEFRDASEVLKKTENDVIPRIENAEDRRELEDLCRQVRQAMGTGDRKKMEERLVNDMNVLEKRLQEVDAAAPKK